MFPLVCPDNWQPQLARLDQSGYINAWMGRNKMSWIQVRHAAFLLSAACPVCLMQDLDEVFFVISVHVLSQVDLQRPTLLHGVQTQGVRAMLRDNYIRFFTISYSLDQETWATYRGNSSSQSKVYLL